MISNYHTHTWRCRHAVGTEEEYVERAIEGGIQTLGFSDHSPYWFTEDYYSTFRMFPEQLPEYVDTVLGLKQKYAGQIDIRLGLETEYYPALFPEFLRRLKDQPIEYLLLGQHYPGNEIGYTNVAMGTTDDQKLLEQYYSQVIDAVYTGAFSYVAHPDIFRFAGEDAAYRTQVRRLCRAVKACGIPLEINLLGIRDGRHYPNERFWEVAAEEGCKAVLGCDAHTPKDAWDPASEQKARELADKYGLELLPSIPLRSIG